MSTNGVQIFVLARNTKQCAKYHCDKHIVKMPTESVQLLCSVLHSFNLKAPYKKTHINHPCAVWARTSWSNYRWLWRLADELGKEYTYRYGREHKAHRVLLEEIPYDLSVDLFQKIALTPFADATSIEGKSKDIVQQYRTFYVTSKRQIASWKNGRTKPKWFHSQLWKIAHRSDR